MSEEQHPHPGIDGVISLTRKAEAEIMEILKRYQLEAHSRVDGFDAVRGKIIWRIEPGDALAEPAPSRLRNLSSFEWKMIARALGAYATTLSAEKNNLHEYQTALGLRDAIITEHAEGESP
jgi:hypothetical protein